MTDGGATEPATTAVTAVDHGQHSAGTLLRLAREAGGTHIAALAVTLKVPVRKLEALEADRYGDLPDTVFVRALAASVCKCLKIDPAPVLARLPGYAPPALPQDGDGRAAVIGSAGSGWRDSLVANFGKPVLATVVVLVLATGGLFLLPAVDLSRLVGNGTTVPATADTVVIPTVTAVSKLAEKAKELAHNASAALPAVTLTEASTSATAAPAASGPALAVVDPAPRGIVVIRARGVSWVEVTDAAGVVQVRKTLANGDVVETSGALPLSVVVGRADMTEVAVRGSPFNLTNVSRDNVARFQVK